MVSPVIVPVVVVVAAIVIVIVIVFVQEIDPQQGHRGESRKTGFALLATPA